MDRFDGTAVRQLLLVDDEAPVVWRQTQPAKARTNLRLLQKDVYAELTRRRRRAQIDARRMVEDRDR